MLHEYENTLRRLIIDLLGANNISAYQVTEDKTDKWLERREAEAKKNNGVLKEKRLLYYSDFYDLRIIVDKNWEIFKPILCEKKRFDVFFDEVGSFRDTIAHGRDLTTGQENLLKGITTDLKTLITLYHNKNENKDDYYIRLLKVTDNFGNNLMNNMGSHHPILRVGDECEIVVEAHDPKGRMIEYELYRYPELKIIQSSNRFTFTIKKEFIGSMLQLTVKARTPDSEYPNEASCWSLFTVLPT